MPMKMPESPMRLFSSVPNLFIAPIQVPYTPEESQFQTFRKESDLSKPAVDHKALDFVLKKQSPFPGFFFV